MTLVPTPRAATYSKTSAGISDVSYTNGIYKFLNASILNVNLTQAFNSTPGSLSVTLAEDEGDDFLEPDVPSVWAISLPKGGMGSVVFPNTSIDLQPDGYYHQNVPFYFCGICTSWSKNIINSGGKTISVSIVDAREILRGVQCLISGFSLSQNIGTGSEENPIGRYQSVDNVIDCFGYWDYGMESDLNEFGMPWEKIRDSILATGVTVNDINIEFAFTGTAFYATPSWYRVSGSIIDILSLVSSVSNDGGSDLVVVSRKINSSTILVEFKAIRRANFNPLTQSEINNFLSDREGMVESATIGKEFRNEPTSKIIIGGMKNSNYLALPSEFKSSMHLADGVVVSYTFTNPVDKVVYSGKQAFSNANSAARSEFISNLQSQFNNVQITTEPSDVAEWDSFPHDIIVRLFGGRCPRYTSDASGGDFTTVYNDYAVDSGAILPFWGFSPGGEENGSSLQSAYPLVEPFLPLDHLVIDRESEYFAGLTKKIPLVKIVVENFSVRNVPHDDVFLDGDGDSDDRPFAKLERSSNGVISYVLNSVNLPGYTRGLPLNTEILRAALAGEYCFYSVYGIYFPEIAANLGFYRINWNAIKTEVNAAISKNQIPSLQSINIQSYMTYGFDESDSLAAVVTNGKVAKNNTSLSTLNAARHRNNILLEFSRIIYEKVRDYADKYMGRQFLACLPKSTIMQRIWNGQSVPTRPEKPEIEYVVSDRGYWENIPSEFDGLEDDDSISTSAELQIKRRFQAEDGRFFPAAIMSWQPEGPLSFQSNGKTKAMFQDLPVNDFRPNKIADGNPEYVFISCSVSQLIRRPDLALVTLPSVVNFDPNDLRVHFGDLVAVPSSSNTTGITMDKIKKFLWYYVKFDNNARQLIKLVADQNNESFYGYASKVIKNWSMELSTDIANSFSLDMASERVMDLKGILIPLTSNWVSYGPWYSTNEEARGMVEVEVDSSLVPWNFERPNGDWDENLNAAGIERLNRSISITDYVDSASITVAGFPEFGLSDNLGFNSNITSINVNFSIDGVRTTYSLNTYSATPGTFRKSDYDDISKLLIDTRKSIVNVDNINVISNLMQDGYGINRFRN